jgi:hypothetical protein
MPEDPPFEPALSDAQPQPGPTEPAPPAGDGDENPRRQELQARQQDRAEELEMAEQSLAFDQEVLEDLIESLASQLPEDAADELTPEQAEQLTSLMSAQSTREALEMFRRLEQMLAAGEQGENTEDPQPAQAELPPPAQLSEIGNEAGVIGGVEAILVELDDLDLATRTIIMKMQPREREELLQGLREDGPEGYREFIRDYFQRLTKVHGADQQ